MKIQFLGTAAAEGIPALFCECDICQAARKKGGRNLRTRSQALIDHKILIDFPADTLFHLYKNHLDISQIRYLLITHSHADHLYPADLENRKQGYAYLTPESKLSVYGAKATYDILNEMIASSRSFDRLAITEVHPFEAFMLEDYRITPLEANHSPQTSPVIYLIQKGEKAMLYGHDSGFFSDVTVAALSSVGRPLSLISLDCTFGKVPGWYHHHMGFDTNLEQIAKLRALGIIDDKTKIIVNHFTHNGLANYDDMVELATPYGIQVAYDGMKVTF